jgi:pSer/pThr/pTyr-binding forkhead associated (FHA) protein
MASLYILKGANQGARLPLDRDQLLLGRSPDCHVVIPSTSVSRQHARIVRTQGSYSIEDMQSRSGTRVNDQVIKAPTLLRDNDKIQICDFVASFHLTDDPPTPAEAAPALLSTVDTEDSDSSTSIRDQLSHSVLHLQPPQAPELADYEFYAHYEPTQGGAATITTSSLWPTGGSQSW